MASSSSSAAAAAGRRRSSSRPLPPPTLLTLPSELQSHIALLLALSSPVGPPADLVPLLATHPILASTLGFEQNPALYAAILEGSWDIDPIRRRFLLSSTPPPPLARGPAGGGGEGGRAATTTTPLPPLPLGDARAQAAELRQRWATLRSVRAFGYDGAGWLRQQQGGGRRQAIDRLERTMLDVFFLLTENDGRNLPHIFQWGRLVHFNLAYHTHIMLPASVSPGYPTETLGHGLHNTFSMWLDEAAEQMRIDAQLLEGRLVRGETEDQTQEKMFVLRPFAFALHKYNPFFVPWNKLGFTSRQGQQEQEQAHLPSSSARVALPTLGEPSLESTPDPSCDNDVQRMQQLPSSSARPVPTIVEPPSSPSPSAPLASSSNARPTEFPADPDGHEGGLRLTHKRFGRDWRVKSTLLNTSCVFGLLNALDRDPRVGGVLTDSSNTSTGSLDFIYTPAEAAVHPPGRTKSFDPVSGTKLRRSLPVLHLGSQAWDNDVKRMLLCAEPTSPGMRLADWRGRFEGEWQGSFAFFDFNGYRDMIGGDEQALFENCFGQQGQQLILHEEVVYVPRHALGGTGPALHCGFPADSDEPDLTRPCPYEEEDLPDPEGSDWVKELMIYGTGRSNWGSFRFRGRVRAFDGLLTLLKEYASELPEASTATRGNWLYRGYVSAEARLIGAWRDTFSPENVRGYEGPFCLRKQADAYLMPEAGLAASGAAASSAVVQMSTLRPFSAGGPQTSSLSRSNVFATTGAEALTSFSKPPARTASEFVASRPMPKSHDDWRAHQTEIVEASTCDTSLSGARRLPFIYPGFSRDEPVATAAASEDKSGGPNQAPEGWGNSIYSQVQAAFQSADVAATLPSIHDTGRLIPYGAGALPEPFLSPPGGSSRKRRASSPPPLPAGPAGRELTKAEGKRRDFVTPPQCNRECHTAIYSNQAQVACAVGEAVSIFNHECDETLGKPHHKATTTTKDEAAVPVDEQARSSPQISRRLSVQSLLR